MYNIMYYLILLSCFFNIKVVLKLTVFFPHRGDYVPSFDLGCLVIYTISEYSISVKPTMNNKTGQTMCPLS